MRVSRKIFLARTKINSSIFSCQTGTSKRTGFYVSDKIKRGFLSANPDMFGANRGKK